MYESFFEMRERPFLAAPRADRYFPASGIEHARQTLIRLIERAEGPALVSASAGLGKSLLLSVVADQFRSSFRIAQLSSARLCTRRALLQAILYELGLAYREREEGELRLSLIDYLSGNGAGNGLLLLVDEAHAMPLRLLEELRIITNFVRDGQQRVRLVLAGQPSLEERFANPKLASFNQRVAARCYLEGLNASETADYVQTQLTTVRCGNPRLFGDDALAAIARVTDGIPRLINQVCDHALLLAWGGGSRHVSAAGIEEAWADLQQLPLPRLSSDEGRSSVVEFGSLDDEPQRRRVDSQRRGADGPRATSTHSPLVDDAAQAIPFPRRDDVSFSRGDDVSFSRGDDGARGRSFDRPEQRLDQIAGQLAALDSDFQDGEYAFDDFEPLGTIGPEVELVFPSAENPFAEKFAEEEVVIDRYASLDDAFLRSRPKVVDRSAVRMGDMLHPPKPELAIRREPEPARPAAVQTQKPAAVATPATVAFEPVMPAPEVESSRTARPIRVADLAARQADSSARQVATPDRLLIVEDEPSPPPKVRRQEYRQLFARHRQIS